MLHKYMNLPTDLCKEVILTEEEQRRYDILGGVQSLVCKYLN